MDITPETWIISFLAGLYTPLGAMCVLPLYPGYLAFLAGRAKAGGSSTLSLGLAVTIGVCLSMFSFGLVFVAILKMSTGDALEILGPAIYGLLAIMSIAMIAGFDISRFFPMVSTPVGKTPYITAALFGAFFGLVALPCNPGSIILLFAISTTTVDFISNFINFALFGIGMASPLLLLSALSMEKSRTCIRFFTTHHLLINRIAGVLMLMVALYYLVFVFLVEHL
ncbi:MAG TPA: cytochrome c biogenesis protein CcdA [Methanospirillum sp.]|jgi:cytochrome c-type biogenesis protein|uniref:cytochrome c biogenesis CcdA family protein n=1 Tax=Methanospirillum sp. TaxID=45200 RepID=UPI002C13FD2F|nr:cytochrome c biogenesis protein CcdA [Methanospirillum sp.]HPY60928.1 cytochrome c biogenesis protein CcdA [Methanospirillum sp.]HQB99642.1 cytochrome c biogenesis protein CcdA [Methanospirillum sp.]